ncbi:MAG: hypothetical protein IAE80_08440 [Anaerolinea sp.]|nr:hypothetical protein [Anaerolinea sp.]
MPRSLPEIVQALIVLWFGVRGLLYLRRQIRILYPLIRNRSARILETLTFDILPPELSTADADLTAAGFSRLSAVRVQTPGLEYPQVMFVYTGDEGAVLVELASFPPQTPVYLGCETWFADGAILLTTYPTGENIQEAHFHARFAAHSSAAAWTYHRAMLARWRTLHGEPRPLRTVEEQAAFDAASAAVHPRLYGRLRRVLWARVAAAALMLVVIAIGLIFPSVIPFQGMVIALMVAVVVWFVVHYVTWRLLSKPPHAVDA